MKILLTILFAVTLTVSIFGQADPSKYILTIKEGKYEKTDNQSYLIVPTTLTNNTNDTLTYLSMSCSWQEFYSVDNDILGVEFPICHWNSTVVLVLAPYKSVETKVKLLIGQVTDDPKGKFKLGFNLIKVTDRNILLTESQEFRKKKNIIWSNYLICK